MNKRLREIRQYYKLSMRDFADKLGMSCGAISLLENGQRNLTSPFINSVCREFNISAHWLRTGEGTMFTDSVAELAEINAELYKCKDTMSIEELKEMEAFLKLYSTLPQDVREALFVIASNMKK